AARRAEAHRARCLELRAAYPSARPRPGARRVVLALGTDLGLCGPFNRVVAQRLAPERRTPGAMVVVIGSRLRVLAEGDQL
ncbi:MAG: F0F1 ATP synthase subunit gamma, partial [Myxococcales bacterium]|nr:F0F1 ATP synthase subunit gamma [Myxococcales bacterium]